MKQEEQEKLVRKIERHEEKREGKKGLSKMGMIGIIGWSVTLPMLGGIALGVYIDNNFKGKYSWTIMLMIAGLFLGCYIAWEWVSKMSGGDGE
jgi:ATP synthase protein I